MYYQKSIACCNRYKVATHFQNKGQDLVATKQLWMVGCPLTVSGCHAFGVPFLWIVHDILEHHPAAQISRESVDVLGSTRKDAE